jgi:hypothetical protein
VLEEVGKALAVGALVLGPDVVEDADVDDRGVVERCVNDAKAVIQGLGDELDVGHVKADGTGGVDD